MGLTMIVCPICQVAWEGPDPCWSCHTRVGEVRPVIIGAGHRFSWDVRFPSQGWVPLWVTEVARRSACWFADDFDVRQEAA